MISLIAQQLRIDLVHQFKVQLQVDHSIDTFTYTCYSQLRCYHIPITASLDKQNLTTNHVFSTNHQSRGSVK